MNTSTEIGSILAHTSHKEAIRLVKEAGFDCYDFSMFNMVDISWEKETIKKTNSPLNGKNYLNYARKLRKYADSLGIKCNQAHAPFPSYYKGGIKRLIIRSIKIASILGAKIIVVHPANYWSAKKNASFFKSLMPYAHKWNIKIASENMWGWDQKTDRASFASCSSPEDFIKVIDYVNDPYCVACLDIGHAEMMDFTNAVEMIEKLGDRLQAVHLHDNDQHHDSHQIMFSMKIDFVKVAKALRKINYQGDITLESDRYIARDYQGDLLPKVIDLANSANKFKDLLINIK